MADPTPRTYQMLWDCPYCGAQKLLGLTHRHCPGCGAPQDPARRYFPSEADKVAVEDHVYHGADRHCQACDSACSARAAHCANCGAPLAGVETVPLQGDETRPERGSLSEGNRRPPAGAASGAGEGRGLAVSPGTAASAPAQGRRAGVLGCLALLFLPVLLLLVALLWKRPTSLTVVGHRWEREIRLEILSARQESAWCDTLPSDAYAIRRRREVRSHQRVPDGEDCQLRRIDRGDGTFEERPECQPRFRDQPIHADRCDYQVNRWLGGRSLRATGMGTSPAPNWPVVALAAGDSRGLGAEREGRRDERLVVQFADSARAKLHDCAMDLGRWQSFVSGTRWTAKMGAVTGALDCSSLRPSGG